MSRRGPRLWFPLAFAAAGSLLTIAVLLLPKTVRPRPTEPETHADGRGWEVSPISDAENRPDPPPWMKSATLEGELRDAAPGLRVMRPEPEEGCRYVCDGGTRPPGVPTAEEYADCWRGVVLCEADPPADAPSGPHGGCIGGFRLFGDLTMMWHVLPAPNRLRYGPWRGMGGPAQPSP